MEKEEAEPLLLEAYSGLKDVLGEEHRYTKSALKDLIHLYESWGKKKQAGEYRAMQKKDLEK